MTVAVMGRLKVGDEIGAQADAGEEEGGEDVGDDSVDQFGGAFAQVRGFADGDADNERAEDRVNAGVFGKCGCGQSEREDETENAAGPAGVGLNVRQELIYQPADDGEGEHYKGDDQDDGALDSVHGGAAAAHHAENHGEEDPTDEVVEHGGGHDHRAHFAAEEVEVHQDFGNDGQRGDGKGGADKQRENQAVRAGGGAQKARK